MKSKILLLSFFALVAVQVEISAAELPVRFGKGKIYHKDWIDFNKNGVKDIFEDPTADLESRIENLLGQMTLEEKTCQMVTLYGYRRVLADQLPTPEWKQKLWKDGIGAIDEHLNSFVGWDVEPSTESPYIWPASTHAKALNEVQRFFIEETRLGIPVDFTNEGIRGVEAYKSTNFPTQLGLGHTWDRELIHEVGRITGREGRLLGYTNVYAPILDVGRDQRWGRYEEIYGEDPYLVAELGVQMVKGLQTDYQVASTAKHFCIYSNGKGAREGSARCDPHEPPHEVENIHMYPWRRVISVGGLLGAMSSYNDYDGKPIQSSRYWLYDRLRTDFGFRGYVVSDSDAVEYLHVKHHTSGSMKESVRQSVEAGLNVRCTFRTPDSYVLPLRELVQEGSISMETIDERVKDILRVKFLVGLFDKPYQQDYEAADAEINGALNNEVALRASQECLVLLKNNGLLPLDPSALKKVAVVGPNADDDGYAHVHYGPVATESVTVYGGLKKALEGKAEVVYAKGCEVVDSKWPDSELFGYEPTAEERRSMEHAVGTCSDADVIVAVMGGKLRTCGENRSRTSLDLPGCQDMLLKELKKTGKPVVLVLINGRPLSINWADRNLDAIIEAWYPGAHGGTAVAQALLGEYNPGGKLSVTFPKTVGQIPFNFPYKPNSQIDGYKGLGPKGRQTRANGALYDFGYGLSYTTFEYSDLRLSKDRIMPGEGIDVTFTLKNTGKYAGDEIVQLYLHDEESSITVYDKLLRGFERVHLDSGESREITIPLPPSAFEMLDENMKTVTEPGMFNVFVGASSADLRLAGNLTVLDPENPDRKFVEDNILSDVLPATLSAGEELLIPLDDNVGIKRFDVQWRMDSDCIFTISINEGGGQFVPLFGKKHCQIGSAQRVALTPERHGSDLKIQVLSGKGTITAVSCEALKK